VWRLTGNQEACARGSNPGGGGIFFFRPFVYLGDVEAVSTCCWQTVSTLEVFSSSSPFCCTVKQFIIMLCTLICVLGQDKSQTKNLESQSFNYSVSKN